MSQNVNPRRPQKHQKPLINTPQDVDNIPTILYNTSIHPRSTIMSVAYQSAQKQRVRITLDLNVLNDFNARDIDFEKLFQLEPTENVEVYIEEFDRY
jgi:hypothetical protein